MGRGKVLVASLVLLGSFFGSHAAPPVKAAQPVRLSDVELRGDWADKQLRDQEVLMSLNMTSYACHFTTTANLTKCESGVPWHTYKKVGSTFAAPQLGFLAAGSDLQPAAMTTLANCQQVCLKSDKCVAVSFEDSSATPTTHPIKCYWKTAFNFVAEKSNCVAPGGDGKPTCEPLPGEMGLGGYYGHYQGHWLSATAFLINNTQNATIKARVEWVLQTFQQVMEAWKAKYGYEGYMFPYDPLVFDKLLAGRGAGPYYSVPFYTLHKLMAGLLDQHVHAGSALALDLVERMAGWTHQVVERTIATSGEELWQKVLLTEWGGMNDVLYNLYEHTGNETYLATARRFNGWVFSAPLAEGKDDLADLPFPHANFHLPEIIGFARAYELTGNATDAAITRNFFEALTTNHSFCTGGSNTGECWQQPRDLGAHLTTQTEESCTQYNVLKIARHLFQWTADAAHADFYERAILNGIAGNQNRLEDDTTSYIYMNPLGRAVKKQWGKSNSGFPCCWGTLSESFAKLSDSIYFRSPKGDALYVNQFVSSRVELPELGAAVEQEAFFPISENATSKLTVSLTKGSTGSVEFSLEIRVPGWLTVPGKIVVNGVALPTTPTPGSYVTVRRSWKDGDVVETFFPPSLWSEPLNDYHAEYNATMAFMYGPLVLAGVGVDTDIFVPSGKALDPSTFIKRNSTTSVEFEAVAANGDKMRMIPLADVMLEQYSVYWMTAGTKPYQPSEGYCPHTHEEDPSSVASGHGVQWGLTDGLFNTIV